VTGDPPAVAGTASATARVASLVRIWRERLARRSAARVTLRSLEPVYRLLGDDSDTHRRRLRRDDPMTELTRQLRAIAAGREQLAGLHDSVICDLAEQWGQALAEAMVLSAAADAQRRGEPATADPAAQTADDRRWDSIDRQLQLASALGMLRSAGLDSGEQRWPARRRGHRVHRPS
jgi:hypothetical protein